MERPVSAHAVVLKEISSLLSRLDRVKPFALTMPMTPAAAPSQSAQYAIERYLYKGRRDLNQRVRRFQRWLSGPNGKRTNPAEVQRRYAFLKLLFNRVLTQFDLFADVLTQRSEHENGIWLSGLDHLAADALNIKGRYYNSPPLMCYLDRGHGAAIRRARTRLPGGGQNPVAVIRVPRERMVGSGIGGSLIHEVGHQGAALLGLVDSLRNELNSVVPLDPSMRAIWPVWGRWISEIIADLWALAHLGVASTNGLMGVVSLPKAFVFRVNLDDPHPIPWIRVKLSCAIGRVLFPDPQWKRVDALWEQLYPLSSLSASKQQLFRMIEASMRDFIPLLINHRPDSLRGDAIRDIFPIETRKPMRLRTIYQSIKTKPKELRKFPPTMVFAVIGQARADGKISPEKEADWLSEMLNFWAVKSSLMPEKNPKKKAAYALHA